MFGHFPEDRLPRYDLLSVILVCIGAEKDELSDTLCGMLYTLFVEKLSAQDKLDKLSNRYGLVMTTQTEGRVQNMCNLSEYWIEQGLAEGRAERDHDKILELLNDGRTPQEIHDFCKYPLELILEVQQELFASLQETSL